MNLRILIIGLLFLIEPCISLSQQKSFNRQIIKLIEYNYIFVPSQKCTDTLSGTTIDGKKLKIYLFDCKGKMIIECFNKKSILIEKGAYINSLDLLKNYSYAIAVGRHINPKKRVTIEVNSYYQPLRNGIWCFYKDNGKLYKKKNYNKGIVIDSILIK